ncbi:MAG: hypothetical protein M0Q23_03270 [Syntrophales bacterium]|nr:hypothetical protein [Syntrophales bacterium]MCK9527666.1 hypothetical protein [Syntrophales bacterium]MDX9922284.1 hypothetical protein [Syntrophales bacterium]
MEYRCEKPLTIKFSGHKGKGRAADSWRVCRVWHRTGEVKVLAPAIRGAEGREKGKGVIVSWDLKEARSKSARRRTGTGYEVWHIRDKRARDHEVLHPQRGVLYKSGSYTQEALCLTPGCLHGVRKEGMVEILGHRRKTGRQTEKTKFDLKPPDVDWDGGSVWTLSRQNNCGCH